MSDQVFVSLSPREVQVLRAVAHGETVDQIARRLYVTRTTVKTHLGNAYSKLGAHNSNSAVWAALRLGILNPPSVRHCATCTCEESK